MSSQRLSKIVLTTLSAWLITAPAFAQSFVNDKRTFYTFSGPVELPGVALPPGKYLFHLADPDTGRKVLEVRSADNKKVYGLFFSMPIERPTASDNPEVRFMESAPGAPQAIRSVWYPGERTGMEFIYPKSQAMRLAKTSSAAVLTTAKQTNTTQETDTKELTRVSSSGQDVAANTNTPAAEPSGNSQFADKDGQIETPVATRGTTPAPVQQTARARLPKTAGADGVFALFGLAFFAGAGAFRAWRTSLL